MEVHCRITVEQEIEVLAELFLLRGVTEHIPRHSRRLRGRPCGPEPIALELRYLLTWAEVERPNVEPGRGWEYGYVQSFQTRLREKLLAR